MDPFASGLLLALSGKLTKAAHLLSDMDKEYEAVFRFGMETDTLDTEGEIIAEDRVPEYQEILKSAEFFNGRINQIPPVFSAIKINGKRAYSQARKGLDVKIPERTVNIRNFEIISWNAPDLKLRILCSKGTYIRSIARDLGIAAGSRAFCLSLRRSAIGPFTIENAVSPDNVTEEDGVNPVDFAKAVGIYVHNLPNDIADRLRGGFPIKRLAQQLPLDNSLTLFTDSNDNPAALVELKEDRWVYRIVFDA